MKAGDVVDIVDEQGKPHKALVTIVHDGGTGIPGCAINVVYVSDDPAKRDPFGQQIERFSSLSVKNEHTAPGGRYYIQPE